MRIFLSRRYVLFGVILILSLLTAGCRTLDSKQKNLQEDSFREKIKKYQALSEDLNTNSLQKGLSASEIREAYGEPDDIFSSGGSTSGSLEIWSYGKILNKDQIDFWHPIRLYFSNNKLIDWNY